MTHPATGESEREARLTAILLEYVEAAQAGRAPDRRALAAAHPDLRGDLEEFFASHDEVERLAAPLRAATRDTVEELGQLGDFRLLREVGRGGMGVVYEAEQISLRRRVALKVLSFAAAIDPRQLQRFKNEAMAAAHLRHENIVPVHAVGCERGVHYYAMQFVEGQSLAALIADLRQGREDRVSGMGPATAAGTASGQPTASLNPLSSILYPRSSFFRWVAGLGRQAAEALEHAHQTGVVHRDVKPANLLLDVRGQLWVTDFGLAQFGSDAGLTVTGEVLGTLRYASPEQARARRGLVDHRSDIYSLGATLYELLTLRPIFDGRDRRELLRQIADEEPRPPRAVNPAIPPELETVVLKALGKEPAERYATAQELADDLQRFLDNRPVLARRPSAAERLRKWARRHPSVVIAGAVVLILLSAGSLASTALIRAEQQRTRAEQRRAEAAYEGERLRAEQAEERFRLARRSVDELIRVSQEDLADRPGQEGLRKRLLTTALTYYREFIEEREGDPAGQAELLDTKERVEKILADLAVLRTSSLLYLLAQPAVLDDLRLSGRQRAQVGELSVRVGKQWADLFREPGRPSPATRARRWLEQARANEAEVSDLLTDGQLGRLRQIGLQAQGAAAFHEPEVLAELKLTPDQRDRLRAIEEEPWFRWLATRHGGAAEPARAKERPANERILEVLTAEQARRWKELIGKPFQGPGPFPPFGPPSNSAGR